MVSNAENALHEVKKKLYNHYKIYIKKEWWVDHQRKVIIQAENKTRFYVLFKRDFFNSYGKITGNEGIGESINIDDFDYAVYEQDVERFLYIYPNNHVYTITPRELRRNAFCYHNEADGKEQYLFSIKKLDRLA